MKCAKCGADVPDMIEHWKASHKITDLLDMSAYRETGLVPQIGRLKEVEIEVMRALAGATAHLDQSTLEDGVFYLDVFHGARHVVVEARATKDGFGVSLVKSYEPVPEAADEWFVTKHGAVARVIALFTTN